MTFTVLAAESDPETLRVLDDAFCQAGFQVIAVEDAQKFIKIFVDVSPDIVIIGALSPEGSNAELCRFVRQSTSLPVIFFSALNDKRSVQLAKNSGVSAYVLTSSGVDQLIEKSLVELKMRDYDRRLPSSETVATGEGQHQIVVASKAVLQLESLVSVAQAHGWSVLGFQDAGKLTEHLGAHMADTVILDYSLGAREIVAIVERLKNAESCQFTQVIILTPFGAPEQARRMARIADNHMVTPCSPHSVLDYVSKRVQLVKAG